MASNNMEKTTSEKNSLTDNLHILLDPDCTQEEAISVYDSWTTYDEDVIGHAYNGHKHALKTVMKLGIGKEARILDVAAGTGLVGTELYEHGYTNIDALDASKELLATAEKKRVYKKLMCLALGEDKLDIDEDTYDVVTCCGCFGYGHIQPNHLNEIVRIAKPGGYVIAVVRRSPPPCDKFCEKLREFIQQLKRNCLVNDFTMENIQTIKMTYLDL
ncbi:methyltransferase-like protein 27 [Saccoglossus kowalevskii]